MILVLYDVSERAIPHLPITADTSKQSLEIPHLGNFSRREFFAKCRLEGVLNIHGVLFSLFQELSMKTYSRVYFSLCLFSVISRRSRIQRKLNSRKKSRYTVVILVSIIYISERTISPFPSDLNT